MENKFIIVTGGSGFIGKSIIHLLLCKGYSVINVDRNSIGYEPILNLSKYHEFIRDLSILDGINELSRSISHITNNVIGLIHLAAYKDLNESYDAPYIYYMNNINCTLNALNLARLLDVDKFISASSAAVYPDDSTGMTNESDASLDKCASPYGYCKMLCERIVLDIAKEYNFNAYNLRYSNPIGSIDGVSIDLCDSMFGNVLNHLDDGEFKVYGNDYNTEDGSCIRDYIDMHDLVEFHIHLLELDNIPKFDTINVGTGVPVSCISACEVVKRIYPKFEYSIGDRRDGDATGSYLGVDKLKSYGFECKWNLETSLMDLINWYKLNSVWIEIRP